MMALMALALMILPFIAVAVGERALVKSSLVGSSVSFVFLIIALFAYDQLKRRGDVIFEELSNELQWSLDQDVQRKAASLDIRVLMRHYVFSSDLPLTRGPYGMGLYLALGVILWLAGFSVYLWFVQQAVF